MATLTVKIKGIDELNAKINEVIEKANGLKQAIQELQEIELSLEPEVPVQADISTLISDSDIDIVINRIGRNK